MLFIVLFTFLPSDYYLQRLAKRWNSHESSIYAART